jgi:hypothetical protein
MAKGSGAVKKMMKGIVEDASGQMSMFGAEKVTREVVEDVSDDVVRKASQIDGQESLFVDKSQNLYTSEMKRKKIMDSPEFQQRLRSEHLNSNGTKMNAFQRVKAAPGDLKGAVTDSISKGKKSFANRKEAKMAAGQERLDRLAREMEPEGEFTNLGDMDTANDVLNNGTGKDGIGLWGMVKKHPYVAGGIALGGIYGVSEMTDDDPDY